MDIKELKKIIDESDKGGVLNSSKSLTGLSGHKITGLMQRLGSLLDPKEEVYLEIGVFQGLSLLSFGLANPEIDSFGIDDFSQCDPNQENLTIVNERIKELKLKNISLINNDYEKATTNLAATLGGKKIGLFFIDGPHDYRSQLMCLLLFKPYLSKNALILVDDSNYLHVRQANMDFLVTNPEYKLIFEAYTEGHPHALDADKREQANLGYWDGINLMLNDPDGKIKPMYPPIFEDKTLFYNEHNVLSAKYADCAPDAIKVARALKPFNPIKLTGSIFRLNKKVRRSDTKYNGIHKHINTFSNTLQNININTSL